MFQNKYIKAPASTDEAGGVEVNRFDSSKGHHHEDTIRAFGEEWQRFGWISDKDVQLIAKEYFDLLPSEGMGPSWQVLDAGCGNGRWTRFLAPHVGHVEALDPSEAIYTAAKNNSDLKNVRWTQASLQSVPFADSSFDLVVCLGVIHHVPDPAEALGRLVRKIKPGGRLLLYIYYALEQRGWAFRMLFRLADVGRRLISKFPSLLKFVTCELIALAVYFPLVVTVRLIKAIGVKGWRRFPLSTYHDKSYRIMRNDALDRFGTPLEQRFSKHDIQDMVESAGLCNITFSPHAPYWHLIAERPLS